MRRILSCVAGCRRPISISDPVPLCARHAIEVVQAFLPSVLSEALKKAQTLEGSGDTMVDEALVVVLPWILPRKHQPLVYFIGNGDRVKIGWTKSLGARIQTLTMNRESVLLVLAGDAVLEKALHTRFRSLQVDDTEWFEYRKKLRDYVEDRSTSSERINLDTPYPPVDAVKKMDAKDARALLEYRLGELISAGCTVIRPQQFADIPAQAGRTRPWVYLWLKEQSDKGRLIKSGSQYRIVKPKEK